MTSLTQETKLANTESILAIEGKLREKAFSSWAFWSIACVSACFYRGYGSKHQKRSINEVTDWNG
jgi:hypothetical protein